MTDQTRLTDYHDVIAIERQARKLRAEATAEGVRVFRRWLGARFAPLGRHA